jgi:hypothetical protein
MSDRGDVASVKHNGLAAIGSGHPHAFIAFHTLKNVVHELKRNEQTLGFVVGQRGQMAPMCAPPVRMLKITPEGISDLTTVNKP